MLNPVDFLTLVDGNALVKLYWHDSMHPFLFGKAKFLLNHLRYIEKLPIGCYISSVGSGYEESEEYPVGESYISINIRKA